MTALARAILAEPFDVLELLGLAAALIAASLFVHHAVDAPVALDALVVAGAVGPFLLRHSRRALRRRRAQSR
jgi:hypothetical protein